MCFSLFICGFWDSEPRFELKFKSSRVDLEPKTERSRTISENMAEMRFTLYNI
jgi:hypothetical protein